MNVRIVKVDLSGVERQLERIADLLEGILGATDPIKQYDMLDDNAERAFYTNDAEEIIRHKLHRLGKEYKPR